MSRLWALGGRASRAVGGGAALASWFEGCGSVPALCASGAARAASGVAPAAPGAGVASWGAGLAHGFAALGRAPMHRAIFTRSPAPGALRAQSVSCSGHGVQTRGLKQAKVRRTEHKHPKPSKVKQKTPTVLKGRFILVEKKYKLLNGKIKKERLLMHWAMGRNKYRRKHTTDRARRLRGLRPLMHKGIVKEAVKRGFKSNRTNLRASDLKQLKNFQLPLQRRRPPSGVDPSAPVFVKIGGRGGVPLY
ncbi:unnamed protein product [Pedinophyceae sp. YPF-701]|nr:unnamed protein product [Pedinophyceae sp. YPF-701]